MSYLHGRRRIQVPTQIPTPMATLYCAGHVHIAQIYIQILSGLISPITRVPIFGTDIHTQIGIRVRVR